MNEQALSMLMDKETEEIVYSFDILGFICRSKLWLTQYTHHSLIKQQIVCFRNGHTGVQGYK